MHSETPTRRISPDIPGYRLSGASLSVSTARIWDATSIKSGKAVRIALPAGNDADSTMSFTRTCALARFFRDMSFSGVVRVFDVSGNGAATPFVAFEKIEGFSLAELIRKDGSFESTRALSILLRLCRSLDTVWSHGKVVFRNLKSSSITMAPGEVPVISSFRSSDVLNADPPIPSDGVSLVGTPSYMAPEQASGTSTLDWKTDQYAAGALLFEMLTGSAPFSGVSDPMETLRKQCEDEILPAQYSSIPIPCAQLLSRMMAKKPEDRYPSWGEAIADIEKLLQGAKVLPIPSKPFKSTVAYPPDAKKLAVELGVSTVRGRITPFGYICRIAVIIIAIACIFAVFRVRISSIESQGITRDASPQVLPEVDESIVFDDADDSENDISSNTIAAPATEPKQTAPVATPTLPPTFVESLDPAPVEVPASPALDSASPALATTAPAQVDSIPEPPTKIPATQSFASTYNPATPQQMPAQADTASYAAPSSSNWKAQPPNPFKNRGSRRKPQTVASVGNTYTSPARQGYASPALNFSTVASSATTRQNTTPAKPRAPWPPSLYGSPEYVKSSIDRYVVQYVRACSLADAKRDLPAKLHSFAKKRPEIEDSVRLLSQQFTKALSFEDLLGNGMLKSPAERTVSIGGVSMRVVPVGYASPVLICDVKDSLGRTSKNRSLALDKMSEAEKYALLSELPVLREPPALASRALAILKFGSSEEFAAFVSRYRLDAFEPLVKSLGAGVPKSTQPYQVR